MINQHLKSLWLTETILQIEKSSGRFADDNANRQAKSASNLTEQLIKRAEILSEQNGLVQGQMALLSSAKIAFFILILVSILVGVGLGLSALAQNPVNLYWALLSLLGMHFITLLFWIISSLFLPKDSGSIFVQCWLWLTKTIAAKKTTSQLLPAFISLFNHQLRYLVGLVVNLLWTVILVSALVVLVALLSSKHYSFEWQSTLLSRDSIISITYYLGALPSMLGFAMPDQETIRLSEQALSDSATRFSWAVWLLGIFIVYGVSLRLIIAFFCGLKWLAALHSVQLDLNQPEYQRLAQRLNMGSNKRIIDHEKPSTDSRFTQPAGVINSQAAPLSALLALDIEESWQPPAAVHFLGFANNQMQWQTILDQLQDSLVTKLLIAVDTDRVPDRGIFNRINELNQYAQQIRIWYINQGRQHENWSKKLVDNHLQSDTDQWLVVNQHDNH